MLTQMIWRGGSAKGGHDIVRCVGAFLVVSFPQVEHLEPNDWSEA